MARDDRDTKNELDKALLACGSYEHRLCLYVFTDSKPEVGLPKDGNVLSCVPLGLSDYSDTYKIDVQVPDDNIRAFFAKERNSIDIQNDD